MNLKDIPDNEIAKRALTIAYIGDFTIRFRGPLALQFVTAAKEIGVRACHYGSITVDTIDTDVPSKTSTEDIINLKVKKWPSLELDDACKKLYSHSKPRVILYIARAIADLDRSVDIRSEHLLEALSYYET